MAVVNLSDELKKLEDLHWRGALSPAEYAKAKDALVSRASPPPLPDVDRIDQEWAAERQKYLMHSKGRTFTPTPMMTLVPGLAMGVFGILWTVLAVSVTGGGPAEGPFAVARFVFPAFGVLFTVLAVVVAIYGYRKALEYQKAEAAYRDRRAKAGK